MTFDDLPDNWSDLPLDTPGLAADVADLVVGHRDRLGGCIGLVIAHPDLTMGQPVRSFPRPSMRPLMSRREGRFSTR